ncbi:MAG: hypothetical protein ACK4LT_03090 [Aquificaceae bacterium]
MRLLLLTLLLVLSGCAVKTWNVAGPTEFTNGLKVSIKTNAWSYSPSDLSRYVIPIYLEVVNTTDEAIELKREDVFLLDEGGNQFNSLEPRDVMALLRGDYGMGFSFGIGYWSSPFGIWWYPYYTLPPREYVYPDIVNKAFTFGKLQPKARLSGFVYFPMPGEDTKRLTLYIKGYRFSLEASQINK